jgi:hypothetical protein
MIYAEINKEFLKNIINNDLEQLRLGDRIPIVLKTKNPNYIIDEYDDMIRKAELVKINKKSYQFAIDIVKDSVKVGGYLVRVKRKV